MMRHLFQLGLVANALVAPTWALRAALVLILATGFYIVPGIERLQARGVLPVPLTSLVFPHVPACQFAPCPRLGWFRDPIDGTRLCRQHTTIPGDH